MPVFNITDAIAELQYVINTLVHHSDASALHSLTAFIDYLDETGGLHLRERLKNI